MSKQFRAVSAFLIGAALAAPSAGHAQTFKVEKWNIGGEGGTDYIVAEAGTGRVFVSRGNHVMVVDGPTGKVIGDILNTPRMHGIGIAPKWNHGFTTNAGDSMVLRDQPLGERVKGQRAKGKGQRVRHKTPFARCSLPLLCFKQNHL